MAFVANDNQQLTLTDSTLNLTQKKGKIWTYDSVYAIGTNYADTALNLVREAGGAGKYLPYKASSMAYIQFAREELPEGEDASFFLCEELMPGYLNGITGEYAPPAGYLVNEKEAEAFDREFPYMEKKKLPGQIFEGDIR